MDLILNKDKFQLLCRDSKIVLDECQVSENGMYIHADNKLFIYNKTIFCITDDCKIKKMGDCKDDYDHKYPYSAMNSYKIDNNTIELYSLIDNSFIEKRTLNLRHNESIEFGVKSNEYTFIDMQVGGTKFIKIYNSETMIELPADVDTREIGHGLVVIVDYDEPAQYVISLKQLFKNGRIDGLKKKNFYINDSISLSGNNNFIVKSYLGKLTYYHLNDDATVSEIEPFIITQCLPYPIDYINAMKQDLKSTPVLNDIVNIVIKYL